MADGFLLDVDTSKLREADNYFKSMISNAEKLQTALKGALGDPKAFAAVNILERVKSFMTEIGDTRLSPKVDTKRLEDFSSEMSNIVDMMQVMSRQKGIQFFDTKSVRDMEGNAFRIQKAIDAIDAEIKKKQAQYNNIQFKAPIDPDTGKVLPKNRKVYKAAVLEYSEKQDAVWREIKALEEKKKGYQEDLRLAKMTEDEKLQYVMKNIAKQDAARQKEINEQRARYKTLLSEQLDIIKKQEQAEKLGIVNEKGKETIEEYKRQFAVRDEERRAIEENYSSFVVDLTENAQRKMLDAELKRIHAVEVAAANAKEKEYQRYLTSPKGALEFADQARTRGEMKEAQKYLQQAMDKVDVSDKATIDKLNDAYTRLRATIESLTTAEKNEQSLQPSLRNEYIRLRKELDANREAQEKFANLKDGNTEDQAALVAREQDLQNKILSIKQNAGALLDETDRQYEAEKSRRAIELAEKTEAQKAEIAKRKAREAYEEYKASGVLSVDKAERLIGLTDNAKNAAQAEKAIKSLENAKKRLDNTDSRYEETIRELNQAIAKHKRAIETTKPAVEAVARVSANEALNNAKSARTMQELRQSLKDLKQAREELDIEDDASKIKEIGDAINNVSDKLDKLEGKQKKVKKESEDLSATFKKLKAVALAWASIDTLKNFAKKVVDVRQEFEKQHKSLQIILQSKEEANKIWQQTQQLALVSPFSIRQLIGYTKQLAAYRIETDRLHNTTKMLADVSAGVGVDMQRLILAYGQVRAASFLRATELRQFTEAGVPLLEELAASLSEVHGRFLSVGDVMDMISKRQVSFKNVEDVFQKMTGQGGVFYKMQEQQAQTIFGLQSNLKDAIDMMYNDIGQSNEGFIKEVLEGMIKIVKSWREWKDIVGATFTMLIFGGAGAGLAKIVTTLLEAKAAAGGLRAVLASIGKIGWVGIISAVAGLVAYLALAGDEADKLQEEMQRIDEDMSNSLQEAISGFKELATTIRSATVSYSEKNKAMDEMQRRYKDILPDIMLEEQTIKAMSSDYKEATDALKLYYNAKAREQKIMAIESKANEQELELINGAIDRFKNYELRRTDEDSDLQYFFNYWGVDESLARRVLAEIIKDMKAGAVAASDIYDEFEQRIAKYTNQLNKLNSIKIERDNIWKQEKSDFEEFIAEYRNNISSVEGLPYETAEEERLAQEQQRVNEYYKERLETISKINEVLSLAYENTKNLKTEEAKQAYLKKEGVDDELNSLYEDIGVEAPQNFAEILGSAFEINEEMERVGVEARNAFVQGVKSGEPLDWMDAVFQYFGGKTTLSEQFEENIKKETDKIKGGVLKNAIEELQKKVVGDGSLQVFDFLLYDPTLSLSDYREQIVSEYERMKAAVEKYAVALAAARTEEEKAAVNAAHNSEQMGQYKKDMPILKDFATLLGHQWGKPTGGGYNSPFPERIKVIDDMVKKYEELRKLFGEDEAIAGAFAAYKDAFADAYKGTKWGGDKVKKMTAEQFMENILNFPNKDEVVVFFDELAKTAKREEDKIKVELAKGEFVYEMKVEAKEASDKDLNESIEKLFSNYELSLDVEKLDLPKGIAKDLFGLNITSLKELKKQVESLRPQFIGAGQIEKYNEYLKKISEMENKAQLERLKKYAKYLEKSMDERVKIKKEELRQIREVEKVDDFTATQKADALAGIKKEAQEKLDKQEWKDFKDSGMYQMIFEDLEHYGLGTLNLMSDKLQDLKNSLKGLDPSQVKEIVSQIEKIENINIERNPFKELAKAKKELEKGTSLKALEQEFSLLTAQKISNDEELSVIKEIQMYKSEGLTIDQTIAQVGEQYRDLVELTNEELNTRETLLQKENAQLEKSLDKTSKGLNTYKTMSKAYEASMKVIQGWQNKVSELFDAITDAMAAAGVEADSDAMIFAEAAKNMVNLVFQAVQFQLQLKLIEVQAKAAKVEMNAMMGVIGWIVLALQGVTTLMSAVLGRGDKSKEKQIQALTEKVEDLQRAFEDLEKATQSAYNIDSVNSGFEAMKGNINEQIRATEQMIQLEQDKKDTDHGKIKEWQNELEDYRKQLKELEDERINQLGGIAGGDAVKSASENFVNAWIDAFKETGDGLSGLEEQFDEVFMNLVKKQVLGRGVDKMLEPLFANLDGMLKDGAMDAQEYEAFNKEWNSLSPQINEFLTKMVNDLGIADDITKKTGELSGLQSGIQGITEDQADILAAYWSSVRFIVSNIEQQFTEYARQMLGSDASSNPILGELKEHTRILTEIDDKLGSIIGHSGGAHVKTYLITQ